MCVKDCTSKLAQCFLGIIRSARFPEECLTRQVDRWRSKLPSIHGGVAICRKLSEETFKLRRTNNFLSQTSEQNATFEDRKVGRQSTMSLRQIAMAATKVQASLLPTPVCPCRQTCPSEVSTAIRTNCSISLGHDQPKRWGFT